jgi:hypothetical protein
MMRLSLKQQSDILSAIFTKRREPNAIGLQWILGKRRAAGWPFAAGQSPFGADLDRVLANYLQLQAALGAGFIWGPGGIVLVLGTAGFVVSLLDKYGK